MIREAGDRGVRADHGRDRDGDRHSRAQRPRPRDRSDALALFYGVRDVETRRPPVAGTSKGWSSTRVRRPRSRKRRRPRRSCFARPANAPAGTMASLILQVPDLDKIESVKRTAAH
jgi:hypothetical protein